MCRQGSEPFWGRRAIVIRKSNEFSAGLGCTSIACRPGAGVRLPQELEHEHTVKLSDDLVQRNGSSVVHHDHFKAVTRVIESSACVQADRQLRGSIVGRNHNRKKWRIAHLHDVKQPRGSDLRIFAQHCAYVEPWLSLPKKSWAPLFTPVLTRHRSFLGFRQECAAIQFARNALPSRISRSKSVSRDLSETMRHQGREHARQDLRK